MKRKRTYGGGQPGWSNTPVPHRVYVSSDSEDDTWTDADLRDFVRRIIANVMRPYRQVRGVLRRRLR